MANVGAHVGRAAEADLGVHVRPVHIDLAAVGVDDVADFPDGFLEHAMSGGVGDHQGGEIVAMGPGLGLEIGDVDVAVVVTGDRHDLEAGADGARRVGAMRREGDETDVAMAFVRGFVERADDKKAGVFALGAGIGLEGNAGEASDLSEPVLEPSLEENLIALQPGGWERKDATG